MADVVPNEAAGENTQTEATQNTNNEQNQAPAENQAPDMHGFTSDQLADMKKFFDANGGFDKVKSRLSNPQKAEEQADASQQTQPTSHTDEQAKQPEQPEQPTTPKVPAGAITQSEFLANQYFKSLAGEEKYKAIAKEILDGSIIKEMTDFNIQVMDNNGNISDGMVRKYLDLRAQTVPAQSTSTEPNASSAPTVQYVEVGDNFASVDQAYEVLMQDADLRAKGLAGHPRIEDAKKLIKETLNKK